MEINRKLRVLMVWIYRADVINISSRVGPLLLAYIYIYIYILIIDLYYIDSHQGVTVRDE